MSDRQRDILLMVVLFFLTAGAAYWVMDLLLAKRVNTSNYQAAYEPYIENIQEEPDDIFLEEETPPPGIIAARQVLADFPFQSGSVGDKLYNLVTSGKKNYNRELYTFLHSFDANNSQLTSEMEEELHQLASVLLAYPNLAVVIDCHTDNSGDRSKMRQITARQAESISQYLQSQGILPKRMDVNGYGSDVPLTSNETEAGRRQNRRIEMSVRTQ